MVAHRAHTKSTAAVVAMDIQAVAARNTRVGTAVVSIMEADRMVTSTASTVAAAQSIKAPQIIVQASMVLACMAQAIMAPTTAVHPAPTVARTAATALTTGDTVMAIAQTLHRTELVGVLHLAAEPRIQASMAHHRTFHQAQALHMAQTQLQHPAQDPIKPPAPTLVTQALDRLLMARHQALARILVA